MSKDVKQPFAIGSDQAPVVRLTHLGDDGQPTATTGRLDVEFLLSVAKEATPVVAPLHVDLRVDATELVDEPGAYMGVFTRVLNLEHLADRIGDGLYLIVLVGGVAQHYQAIRVVNE